LREHLHKTPLTEKRRRGIREIPKQGKRCSALSELRGETEKNLALSGKETAERKAL